MTSPNNGKTAVVTGANRGLGLEVTKLLAQLDYKVFMAIRNPDQAAQVEQSLKSEGLDVVGMAADMSSEQQVNEFAEKLASQVSSLDVLVNNAGVFLERQSGGAGVAEISSDTVAECFNTNTLGPYRMTQKLLPLLKKSESARVVNVSSGMGGITEMEGGFPAYRLSKSALNALTRIMATEFKDSGILVNSVCPGWVRTDMGGPNANRGLEEGGKSILWAATLPDDGPTGGFFRDGKEIAW